MQKKNLFILIPVLCLLLTGCSGKDEPDEIITKTESSQTGESLENEGDTNEGDLEDESDSGSFQGEPHTEHTYGEWETTISPTCKQPGEQSRSCIVCGQTETEEIPALGGEHDFLEPGVGYLVEETGEHIGLVEYEGSCARCGSHFCEDVQLYFAIDDWDTIGSYSNSGAAKDRYVIGETRDMVFGENTITVRIIDFDHDETVIDSVDYNNGTNKAGITIETVTLLADSAVVNSSATNDGGWKNSELRKTTLNAEEEVMIGLLEDSDDIALYDVFKCVYKYSNAGNNSGSIIKTEDYFFPLSVAEIYSATALESEEWDLMSNNAATYEQEGTQYAFYKYHLGDLSPFDDSDYLERYKPNATSSTKFWTRSAVADADSSFYSMSSGGLLRAYANIKYGVTFCFCV